MKLTLRILLFIHIALIFIGLYSVLINGEYIRSSKYIFIGLTGFLVFLNTLLIFPIHLRFQNVLLLLGFVLYTFSATGFFFPIIFKNYWGVLFGIAIFLFLMSLYSYSGRGLFKSKLDYIFTFGCLLVSTPLLFGIEHNNLVLFSGLILVLLTVVVILRIIRFQSK